MCYTYNYVLRPWNLERVGCKKRLKNFKKYLYVYTYIKLLLYILSRYVEALVISWDHFLCAFVAKDGLQAFSASPACLLSFGHSLTSGANQKMFL
jgi:hypothetical protein